MSAAIGQATIAHPWDRAAEGWHSHSAIVDAWLRDATQEMLDAARVTPGARVLDVAAGAGGQTLDAARVVGSGGEVLATDISARILAFAAAQARSAGLSNIRTQVADAQALDLAGSGFDAAISRLGLMFCAQPLLALQQIAAALKPEGRLAAVVFSHPAANPCIAILMATACQHAGRAPPPPFTPGTLLSLGQPGLLGSLAEQAGFTDVDVRALSAPFRLASTEDYAHFVRTGGSPIMEILAPLSAQAQAAAWADISDRLEAFAGPTGWVGPNELLLVSGRRRPAS